ncbi:hypothetical protein [Massiliimalia massiliensis]|uniref:hypothetical protein n=1 Tax=Massiliimalia massiliensis TaxID=1852384 RepID=UPI0009878CEC|nr:hypothetical protein [Massiliimalia massiliensis]
MKKVVSAFILVLTLACFSVVGVYAAVVEKPVIEAEMPDCYREIGNGSIVLYANATVPNGGTVRYQWYVADTENMAMIHAIFGAESDIYQVPEEIGVKWYCYAAWNVSGGAESDPVYSRLIRVEYFENTTAHIHSFCEWMVITEPTCTEIGIKVRECDCGVTERAEVPATGHNWDSGKITKKPTAQSDGEKVYTCLNCKAIKVKTVKFSGISEESDTTNNTAEPDNNSESTIEPTNIGSYEKTHFPWWLVAVIVVPVIGCIVIVVILLVIKKQKNVR